MSLSKNRIKYIKSQGEKKYRSEHDTFVAEGTKLVFDLLGTCRCRLIAALPSVLSAHPGLAAEEVIAADESELKKATFLKTAPQIIGVFYRPAQNIEEIDPGRQLCLALDGIRDPGNVGAIVRTADWFGIEHIICSPDTADVFNPKTIQATMGAIARVKVIYTGLAGFLQQWSHCPVYGTFLEGENLYSATLSGNGLIVMGSEGRGIGSETEKLIGKKLLIPNFPAGRASSESLNVAAATAIICAEFRRRLIK
ncbi:MAG: RNA methyltransferase [Proteiniphilum sp.]|jgi:TrmH family RNA methyltransferase|nr:RNA methyltransferase [Proteiniphilum sp.]